MKKDIKQKSTLLNSLELKENQRKCKLELPRTKVHNDGQVSFFTTETSI
jgi:hypothetical protein